MLPVWFNHTNPNMKKTFFIITFFWTIVCTIASGEVHAQPYKAVVFAPTGLTPETKFIALALAGIVNRDSARLYLRNVYENWSYNQTDEQFEALYRTRGNVQFEEITTITALVNRFRGFINGAITYDITKTIQNYPTDPGVYWQAEFAGTLGGLTNRLPCTTATAASLGLDVSSTVTVTDAFDGDAPITVTGRLETGNTWNNAGNTNDVNYDNLLTWGVQNILPRCNPKKFYCRELCDIAVQNRMFQTNIAGPSSLDFNQLPGWKATILENVLNYLHNKNFNSLFGVYGWLWPEPIVQWIASFGATFQPILIGNLSFHGTFPVLASTHVRPSYIADYSTLLVDNTKHYVTIIGTEGDSGNWSIGFQSGAWLSNKRGAVPLTWGTNLVLFEDCPFVANYFMETATANDGFVAAISPLGYTYLDMIPAESRAAAVAEVQRLMTKYKINDIYAYKHYAPSSGFSYRGVPISNNYNVPKLSQINRDANVLGATYLNEPTLPFQAPSVSAEGQLFFNQGKLSDANPTFYGNASSTQAMADRILNLLRPRPTPSFLIGGYQRLRQDDFANRISPSVADMSLAMVEDVINRVKADPIIGNNVEFVTAEKLTGLMRKNQRLTSLLTLPAPWTKPASWNTGLPADVEVYQFQGNIAGSAVKAFAVAVNLASPVVRLSPEGAATLRTPTQFYNDAPSTTPIVVNGGFFGSPNQSFSLLIKNEAVIFPNIKTVTRSFNGVNTAYYPTRGAFGVSACCNTPTIQWIYNVGASNTTYVYPQPSPNTTAAAPQPQPTALFPANGNVWGAGYAIGGSPVLIKNGTIQITDTEELISVNNTTRRARTAIGYMLNNVAVMLVVEEGTSQSVGVTLQQLATMMKDIGMFEALNLDGGGSTTLLINGVQAIQPSDGSQRAMSTVVTVKF
jgi:hypothetical protein